MLALRIEYLTGRCVATAFDDRSQAEWPPHPARLYSALVATWHTNDCPNGQGEALRWLEAQPPPNIAASRASHRSVLTHFVPVNDAGELRHPVLYKALALVDETLEELRATEDPNVQKKLEKKLVKLQKSLVDKGRKQANGLANKKPSTNGVLPSQRLRQARTFPSVTPEDPAVHLIWPEAPSTEIRADLDALVRGLVRLGHSSSLVTCRLVDEPPEGEWHPDVDGSHILRVPEPGQLSRLELAYAGHQAVEPRILPSRMVSYRRGRAKNQRPVVCSELSDQWLVFHQVGGSRLSHTQGVLVAQAVRGALLKYAEPEGPLSEVLSGHGAQGAPAKRSHLAILPLPFVGHARADGQIRGVALALPRDVSPEDECRLLRAVGRWEEAYLEADPDAPLPAVEVQLGQAGVLYLRRQLAGVRPLRSLDERTWSQTSRRWISITPVALGRNPGNLNSTNPTVRLKAEAKACESIALACERVGLPRPQTICLRSDATVSGGLPVKAFPAYPPGSQRVGSPRRLKVHAEIVFAEPVRGPLVLGAGRHYGLGLFKPLKEEGGA